VSRQRTARLAAGAALLLASSAAPATAHPLAPSLLALSESPSGVVEVRWRTPLSAPRGARPEPVMPGRCASLGAPRLVRDGGAAEWRGQWDCGPQGLGGLRLRVRGLDGSRTAAVLRVARPGGGRLESVLRSDSDELLVPRRPGSGPALPWHYARLGLLHVLQGLDHLAFVLALLWQVRGARRLAATLTAFTLGHSVTLAAAALGLLVVPPTLAEAGVALSLWVAAVQLVSARRERTPWLTAGGFGLVHGLGFAGALRAAGLPPDGVVGALLGFNLGIEAGQAAVATAALVLGRALAPALGRRGPWARVVFAYGLGSVAVARGLERGAAWWTTAAG